MKTQGQPAAKRQHEPNGPVIDAEFEDGDGFDETKLATVRPMHAVRTQTHYQTAMTVPRPRVLKEVRARAVEEAGLAAEEYAYRWTIGSDVIEGVSIEGAMILFRAYGNCVAPIEMIVDAPEFWMFRATFIDLETGATIERPFRQRKNVKMGKMDADRKLEAALQIGVSKAQRNVIEKAMPVWLKKAAWDAAEEAVKSKIKDVPKVLAGWVEWFSKVSEGRITVPILESKFGAREVWSALTCIEMTRLQTALRGKQTSLTQEFPDIAQEEPAKTVAVPATTPQPAKPAPAATDEAFTAPSVASPAQTPDTPTAASQAPDMCKHDLIRSTCPDCKGETTP